MTKPELLALQRIDAELAETRWLDREPCSPGQARTGEPDLRLAASMSMVDSDLVVEKLLGERPRFVGVRQVDSACLQKRLKPSDQIRLSEADLPVRLHDPLVAVVRGRQRLRGVSDARRAPNFRLAQRLSALCQPDFA